MEDILNLHTLSIPELLARVGLAMLFGMVIGLDREHKNKPIEFRAYMIVCVTSCIIAILGNELYHLHVVVYKDATMDMAKIIEGTLTGIGFLGAGAIIHKGGANGNEVIGTATGASIWGAGGIGLKLWEAMRTNSDWENVAYMVLLILLVVYIFDAISNMLRSRLMGSASR